MISAIKFGTISTHRAEKDERETEKEEEIRITSILVSEHDRHKRKPIITWR